jgi:hypothetical protein
MKSALLIPLVALALAPGVHAQKNQIFRCGNTYTNDAAEARARQCKLVEGGNVSAEQKARDADARAILDAELRKAEARRTELAKEFNNGEPEMLGPEHRNHQKYLDRIAQLKDSIARNEQDIAGIQRELARVGANAGGTVPASR